MALARQATHEIFEFNVLSHLFYAGNLLSSVFNTARSHPRSPNERESKQAPRYAM
jgi:hypothetical protein